MEINDKIKEYIQEEIKKYFEINFKKEMEKYNNRNKIICKYCNKLHDKYDYCQQREEIKQKELKKEYEQAVIDGYSFFGTS